MSQPVSRTSRSRLTVSRSPTVEAADGVVCEMPEDDAKGSGNFWEDMKGDWNNVFLLSLLYIMQGIPIGLAGLIPLLLVEKGIGMNSIAVLTTCTLPYSVKLLWAPIVDSVFSPTMGRRKTWMVPAQLLIGLLLFFAPIEDLVHNESIYVLWVLFTTLYFCAATQDIAVDAWALEILSRKNRSLASPCNSAGQSFGIFLSSSGYLCLQSFLSLTSFNQICGVCFIVITLCVWAFKPEDPPGQIEDYKGSYKVMYDIAMLRSVWLVIKQFALAKIPFAIVPVAVFHIQEGGISKEEIATVQTLGAVSQIIVPALAAKWIKSIDGMLLYDKLYVPRLLLGPVIVILAYLAPTYAYSTTFTVALVVWQFVESILGTVQFVAQMAFFNKVSDPAYGGTYMTFLNTIANIGALWPVSFGFMLCGQVGFHCFSFLVLSFGVLWYVVSGRSVFQQLAALQQEDWVVR